MSQTQKRPAGNGPIPESNRRRDCTQHIANALGGAHPDLFVLTRQWVSGLAEGATFTAAQLGEVLPMYADDKPCRRGALIRDLNRKGYIEFHGYGPRAAHDDWDAPARVWRRTSKPFGGAV